MTLNRQEQEARVRQVVSRAKTNPNRSYFVYLDRLGGVDVLEVSRTNDVDYALMCFHGLSSKPCFEIISILGNDVFANYRDYKLAELTDPVISEAVQNAVEERERFYKEREATYGVSAWPREPMRQGSF